MATIFTGAAMLLGVAGLRRSWASRGAAHPLWLLAGWAAIIASVVIAAWGWGGEIGIPAALTVVSVVALGFVAANVQWRAARQARVRTASPVDPSDRPSRIWRGIVRTILAGPLAGAASVGVGVALATRLPLGEADRIAIGGLTIPLLWAGGMAWTLADDRIFRAFAVLVLVAAVSYSIAFI